MADGARTRCSLHIIDQQFVEGGQVVLPRIGEDIGALQGEIGAAGRRAGRAFDHDLFAAQDTRNDTRVVAQSIFFQESAMPDVGLGGREAPLLVGDGDFIQRREGYIFHLRSET